MEMEKRKTKPKQDDIIQYLNETFRGCKIIIYKSMHVCMLYNNTAYIVQHTPRKHTTEWYKYGVNNVKNITIFKGGITPQTLTKAIQNGQAVLI